jgi:hypothetical protein
LAARTPTTHSRDQTLPAACSIAINCLIAHFPFSDTDFEFPVTQSREFFIKPLLSRHDSALELALGGQK